MAADMAKRPNVESVVECEPLHGVERDVVDGEMLLSVCGDCACLILT